MRRPTKRTVLILTALLLLGITVIVWEVADWPSPRLILKYGFPPTGGPTGRTKVLEGIEFVEIAAGVSRFRREHTGLEYPLWHQCLPFLDPDRFPDFRTRTRWNWVEVGSTFWISRELIPYEFKRREFEEAKSSDPDGDFADVLQDDESRVAWLFSRLAARTGGRFRVPERREVLFAHSTGSLTDTEDSRETVVSDGRHEELWFRDSSLVTGFHVDGGSRFRWFIPEVRLVWIPPEPK